MGEPLRVLIVEDSEDDAALLVRELRRGGYEPVYRRVETFDDMNAALESDSWDLIVSDYAMPHFNGLSALALVQQRGLDLPFIIMSGAIGEEIAVGAMKAGAHDYIMKGDPARLIPAIQRELREAIERRERKEAEALVQEMAYVDSLTDLPNRNSLLKLVKNAIRNDNGAGQPMALLLMDLDRFREVNDTLGHDRGDQLLQQVGRRLQSVLFEPDVVARLGGDEFAILLPRLTRTEDVNLVIQKIQSALEEPFCIDEFPIAVEASIGVVIYPDHGTQPDVLLRRADVAMYAAKERGCSIIYDVAHDRHNPRRLALMGELRPAIEQDQLALHYQPKIDLKTDRIVGVEALARWRHPEQGFIPPDQFIPPAERTGLIKPLTQWILKTALRQGETWHREGKAFSLAVNLSMRNLLDPTLPGQLANLLEPLGGSAEWLELEITESAIMSDTARALECMMRLRTLGARLSIDDFGTGYSSLGYLKRLPVDTIKIDKSFVIHMVEDENDAVIVRSTIDLGHNLGLTVIAEGVENEETYKRLQLWGCDAAQGYHMGKPMPHDALTCWLAESPWGMQGTDGGGKEVSALTSKRRVA